MRKIYCMLSLVIFCSSLVLSGCAKEQLKQDETMAAPPADKQSGKPSESAKQPVTEQRIVSPAIKESPVARDEAALSSAANEQVEKLLNAIFFDFDSSTLSQSARDNLSKNASVLLKKQTGVAIQIEGHCDERGSAEYNLALGERRAKSAMTYLVTLGVPASRLSTISYGKEKPADTGHDEAAWAKNRRAEFMVAK